jgi:hypothetical protein
MSLPNSQLQILAAIENELQADPELDSAFLAFTSVTHSAEMPAAEQLAAPGSLTGRRGWRRLGRMIVPLVVLAATFGITLAVVLAALSAGDHTRCGPQGAVVHAGFALTCVPLSSVKRAPAASSSPPAQAARMSSPFPALMNSNAR